MYKNFGGSGKQGCILNHFHNKDEAQKYLMQLKI